jgi:hypothetical protein
VDASLLVGVVEGAWSEDVKKLEKEQFHNGWVWSEKWCFVCVIN